MELKNLEEIDEPIRDIILQLNKLGYKTIFSCAGYNYPGHVEKYHELFYPYVVFKSSLKNARKLAEVLKFGWEIELSHHYSRYNLVYPFERDEKSRKESWRSLRKLLDKIKKII